MLDEKTRQSMIDMAKEQIVSRVREGNDTFPLCMTGWYDGLWRVHTFPSISDRNQFELTAKALICAASLDAVTLVSDTWYTHTGTKKDGSQWGPGEMERAVREQTEDADSVMEAVIVQISSRTGIKELITIPYTVVQGEVVWEEELSEIDYSGYIQEVFDHYWSQKCMVDYIMERDTFNSDANADDAQFMYDYMVQEREKAVLGLLLVTAKEVLAPAGVSFAIAAHREDDEQLIKSSLKDSGVSYETWEPNRDDGSSEDPR